MQHDLVSNELGSEGDAVAVLMSRPSSSIQTWS